MTQKILLSTIILALMAAMIGGTAASWFSRRTEPLQNSLTAGTVAVTSGDVIVTSDGDPGNLIPGECSTVSWCITNTGSKRAYLRVRKIDGWDGEVQCEEETAWGEGTPAPGLVGWGMYFDYEVGQKTAKTVNLIAGQNWIAGTVTVWEDNKNIFVRYNTVDGWKMNLTHLYVGESIPQAGPGGVPYKHSNLNGSTEDLFIIPKIWKNKTTLYIAAHAEVGKCREPQNVAWTLTASGWTYNHSDGYWYYCQQPLWPGDSVCIEFNVCLEGESSPGREYFFNFIVEAVQASNNAIHFLWPGNPCQ